MGKVSRKIKNVAEHPVTQMLTGFLLLISGTVETYQNFINESKDLQIGAHHGVMILGIISIMASVPDIIDGLSTSVSIFDERDKK